MARPGAQEAQSFEAPICGWGQPGRATALRHMPVWAFHGVSAAVVSLPRSQGMVEAVNAAGGDARLTVYPEAGHDSWTVTYVNPELYEWLLSRTRRGR